MADAGEPNPWLTPPEAIKLCRQFFGLDDGGSRQRLMELAADEVVRTWCVKFVFRDYDEWSTSGGDTFENDEVPARFWNDFQKQSSKADWTNGVFSTSGYQNETRVHGVRFSGADLTKHKLDLLAAGTQQALAALTTTRTENKSRKREAEKVSAKVPKRRAQRAFQKPVIDAEVRGWHAALAPEDRARGIRWLYPEAKRHFHPRHVAKKLALGLVEGRPRGRPRNP